MLLLIPGSGFVDNDGLSGNVVPGIGFVVLESELVSEAATAADEQSFEWGTTGSLAEAIDTPTDIQNVTLDAIVSLEELTTPSDSPAVTSLDTSASIEETGTAADDQSIELDNVSEIEEPATADDTQDGQYTAIDSLSETTTPADENTAANESSRSLTETTTPADNSSSEVTGALMSLEEAATASDTTSVTLQSAVSITELLTAEDGNASSQNNPTSLNEQAFSSDSTSSNKQASDSRNEQVTSGDIFVGAVTYPVSRTETLVPSMFTSGGLDHGATLEESAFAADNSSALLISNLKVVKTKLNSGSSRATRRYSDLNMLFVAHPITGELARVYDEDAIKRSVKNLVLTNYYDRKFHSEIGSGVNRLLFENASPFLQASLKKAIINVITNFEPRVEVLDVSVGISNDSSSANITILFKIVNTEKPLQVNMILNRSR